jgi:hypothetical protein
MSRLSIFAVAAVQSTLAVASTTEIAFAKEHHHVRKAPHFNFAKLMRLLICPRRHRRCTRAAGRALPVTLRMSETDAHMSFRSPAAKPT